MSIYVLVLDACIISLLSWLLFLPKTLAGHSLVMKVVFIPLLNGYEGGSLIISDHSKNLFPLHVVSWSHLYSATEYVILPLSIKVRFFLYHMLILI